MWFAKCLYLGHTWNDDEILCESIAEFGYGVKIIPWIDYPEIDVGYFRFGAQEGEGWNISADGSYFKVHKY